jgi:hypothetical protein
MPAAKTVRQKDELHGELGTVDAISERVRRERVMKPENIKKYDTLAKGREGSAGLRWASY